MADGRLVFVEWNGKRRPRVEVIRELFAAGAPVADIARQLAVQYQIVYMAVRDKRAPVAANTPPPMPEPFEADAILLGCVSQKNDAAMPAKDLYRSELFRRRRLWAEAARKPWWIVSAEYGLVGPDQVIAPYDTRIGKLPLEKRHAIAEQVASRLRSELGSLDGKRLELHAGDEYFLAVAPALRREGAVVFRPLEGLRIGEQLAWYGHRLNLHSQALQPSPEPPTAIGTVLIGDGRGLSRRLTELFMAGSLDLSTRPNAPEVGWDGMPEVRAVQALRASGADYAEVRLYLTFNAAMDRARDADKLAESAVRMWRAHAWTVQPERVVQRSLTELADVLRSFGVSQRHNVDAFAWRIIAETLLDTKAASETRSAIYGGEADAKALMTEVRSTSPDGTARFPLLGGPKISALWARLLAHPGGAQISSLETVPVAVDVQVRKVTEYMGVTDTGPLALDDVRTAIQETWSRDVASHGAAGPDRIADTPGALDPALWFYGKWGCTFCQQAKAKRPISPICAECRYPATS